MPASTNFVLSEVQPAQDRRSLPSVQPTNQSPSLDEVRFRELLSSSLRDDDRRDSRPVPNRPTFSKDQHSTQPRDPAVPQRSASREPARQHEAANSPDPKSARTVPTAAGDAGASNDSELSSPVANDEDRLQLTEDQLGNETSETFVIETKAVQGAPPVEFVALLAYDSQIPFQTEATGDAAGNVLEAAIDTFAAGDKNSTPSAPTSFITALGFATSEHNPAAAEKTAEVSQQQASTVTAAAIEATQLIDSPIPAQITPDDVIKLKPQSASSPELAAQGDGMSAGGLASAGVAEIPSSMELGNSRGTGTETTPNTSEQQQPSQLTDAKAVQTDLPSPMIVDVDANAKKTQPALELEPKTLDVSTATDRDNFQKPIGEQLTGDKNFDPAGSNQSNGGSELDSGDYGSKDEAATPQLQPIAVEAVGSHIAGEAGVKTETEFESSASTPSDDSVLVGQVVKQSTSTPTSIAGENARLDVNQPNFVDRVAQAVRTSTDNGHQVTLKLDPPELGSIQIDVSMRNGVLTARLETQTNAAQKALMENLTQLKETLSQNGASIERIEVNVADNSPNDRGWNTSQDFLQQNDRQNSSQGDPELPPHERFDSEETEVTDRTPSTPGQKIKEIDVKV